jgi:hypothetical protein
VTWAAVVFGWPAVVMSVLVGSAGVFNGRWPWTLAGAIAGAPFLLSLSLASPLGWVVTVPVALSYAAAVRATYLGRAAMAWLFFAPMPALAVYVAIVVELANQSRI